MFESISKYRAILRVGFKQELAYKSDYIGALVFRLLSSFVMIFVWITVFANTGATAIGGFTLTEMYLYFFLVNALVIFTYNNTPSYSMQNDVQSGNITTSLIRPLGYPTQVFFNTLAINSLGLLSIVLPSMAIIIVIGHIAVSPMAFAFFIAEILLAYAITTLLSFIIGTLSVYFINIWGLISVTNAVYFLLGGGVMPLNLLPSWASGILLLLPSQLSLYAPAATLLGMLSESSMVQSIAVGAVWAVALFVFSIVWWRMASKKITSAGG